MQLEEKLTKNKSTKKNGLALRNTLYVTQPLFMNYTSISTQSLTIEHHVSALASDLSIDCL